jgi:hypothetical protein
MLMLVLRCDAQLFTSYLHASSKMPRFKKVDSKVSSEWTNIIWYENVNEMKENGGQSGGNAIARNQIIVVHLGEN